jgi:hypothetical protein
LTENTRPVYVVAGILLLLLILILLMLILLMLLLLLLQVGEDQVDAETDVFILISPQNVVNGTVIYELLDMVRGWPDEDARLRSCSDATSSNVASSLGPIKTSA